MTRFITFEGLDGSGKSTHLVRVAEELGARDVPHLVTREPGGSALGREIRDIFLDHRWAGMDGIVELLLVAASRRQHLLEVIEPALARGEVVLCDRFSDSTWAYQGAGRGLAAAAIEAADELATAGRMPDRTILFDLPSAEAQERSRGRRGDRSDRLDVEELGFFERVRAGFLERARREPERIAIIDSSGSFADTAQRVRAALEGWTW